MSVRTEYHTILKDTSELNYTVFESCIEFS
jgi:hypothetical protein